MKTIYIYKLIDPFTLDIRYIGKTTNVNRRLSAHIARSKENKYHSALWIRKIIESGSKPIIEIVEECTEENWQIREKYWISYYKEIYDLTNVLEGGEGGATYGRLGKPWTDQQRINNRKARLGKPVNMTKESKIKRADGIRKYCYDNKKPVIQYDLNEKFVKEWGCAVDAGKELNINYNNINKVCQNLRSHAGNFKWKFKGDII